MLENKSLIPTLHCHHFRENLLLIVRDYLQHVFEVLLSNTINHRSNFSDVFLVFAGKGQLYSTKIHRSNIFKEA